MRPETFRKEGDFPRFLTVCCLVPLAARLPWLASEKRAGTTRRSVVNAVGHTRRITARTLVLVGTTHGLGRDPLLVCL